MLSNGAAETERGKNGNPVTFRRRRNGWKVAGFERASLRLEEHCWTNQQWHPGALREREESFYVGHLLQEVLPQFVEVAEVLAEFGEAGFGGVVDEGAFLGEHLY